MSRPCRFVVKQEIRGITNACRQMGYSRVHVRAVMEGRRANCDTTLAAIAFYHPELLDMPCVPGWVQDQARKAIASRSSEQIRKECDERRSAIIRQDLYDYRR